MQTCPRAVDDAETLVGDEGTVGGGDGLRGCGGENETGDKASGTERGENVVAGEFATCAAFGVAVIEVPH